MAEADGGEGVLSVGDAVAEIGRLQSLRGALQRRNGGITWMIWGLATSAIFVTYDFLGLLGATESGHAMYLMSIAWVPWVGMGVLATRAVWSSAGLVMPGLGNRRAGVVRGLLFLVASMLTFWIVFTFDVPVVEPAVFLAVVGLVSIGFGVTGFACVDNTERLLQAMGGTLLVVLAVVPWILLDSRDAAYAFYSFLAPLSVAIVYFGIGIFLTLRG